MSKTQRYIEYEHNGVNLRATFYLSQSKSKQKLPAILLTPTVAGPDAAFEDFSERYRNLGYHVFVVDMYGKDMLGAKREDLFSYMNFLLSERQLLQDRIKLALEHLLLQPEVDSSRIVAAGYCFGGLCSLDLARTGADIKGVISLHGLLTAPDGALRTDQIKPRVLVLHGSDDPLAPMEQVNEFKQEMNAANANWEMQLYGNVAHAFTNPMADGSTDGILYNEHANKRSWVAVKQFLSECFIERVGEPAMSETDNKIKNLLFVCVENSCRSQMSQAFAVIHGDENIRAYSSGSKPSGIVNPKAIASMAEIEYDLSHHDSKSLDEIPDIEYDAVVTMGCGDACPYVKAKRRVDWQIPDPKHMEPEEFAEIRDMIGEKIKDLIKSL